MSEHDVTNRPTHEEWEAHQRERAAALDAVKDVGRPAWTRNWMPSEGILPWQTTLSPAEFTEALAAAKAEGAREAVERIRPRLVNEIGFYEGEADYDDVNRILDEEGAR